MKIEPLTRFSNRAESYAHHRPSYPQALYDHLRLAAALAPGALVADIGSGTGLLSKLFLENGHPVIGVEPNGPMRAAGEVFLAAFPDFKSLDGAAEELPLDDNSVDLLVAGQAFHWFQPTDFRREAQRVLRPGAHAALIWNRRDESDPFVRTYEQLLNDLAVDYYKADPKHRLRQESILEFFQPRTPHYTTFPNPLPYDWGGLQGLASSQSYVPLPDHPNYVPFFTRLEELFEQFNQNGAVTLALLTHLYHGPLGNG
jgi:SAM-dependent methyltransferase